MFMKKYICAFLSLIILKTSILFEQVISEECSYIADIQRHLLKTHAC